MSVARGFGINGKSYYTNVCKPCDVNLNWVVDSTNGNGLGIRSLKSNGYVEAVYMNTTATTGIGGSPNLGSARLYGALAASALTNTGSTTVAGNIGVYPGTAVTGFPPGTFTGVENVANVPAQNAQASALAAYLSMQAMTPTGINSTLDGQSLTPGVYKATSGTAGTFSLAASGPGTLTLTGNGVYIFQTSTTLVTGSGGTPTITLAGGATAAQVYWVVGSTATINSGNAGTFNGNVIALTSITDTSGGTVNGSLIALNGAVTFSAATVSVPQPVNSGPVGANPNPLPGFVYVKFKNNFNYYLGGFVGFVSPVSGTPLTSTVAGQPYIIVSLGTATLAQWLAAGFPPGFTPAVGASFIATASGTIGGSAAVETPSTSGVSDVELIGDPNQTIANSNIAANAGSILLLQFLFAGAVTPPKDNTVVGMTFKFDGSSVTVDGI
jgi:hypothetical protein